MATDKLTNEEFKRMLDNVAAQPLNEALQYLLTIHHQDFEYFIEYVL